MYQYEMFELSLTGEPPQGSQALFTFQTVFHLDGEEKTVKGFYAGSNTYKVRFLPKKKRPVFLENRKYYSLGRTCGRGRRMPAGKDRTTWYGKDRGPSFCL